MCWWLGPHLVFATHVYNLCSMWDMWRIYREPCVSLTFFFFKLYVKSLVIYGDLLAWDRILTSGSIVDGPHFCCHSATLNWQLSKSLELPLAVAVNLLIFMARCILVEWHFCPGFYKVAFQEENLSSVVLEVTFQILFLEYTFSHWFLL